MHALTFTDARKHFAETMQRVSDNAEPVRILRRDAPDVIIIGAHEYDAMVETLHLFSNPVNAAHINASLDELERGDIVEIDV
ncbi:type II toxin-antitoxin system Phd/YefM family antitoxin [Serratia symbiotica]|uniref:Antitoxin n=2 Tax=Serratia symbiotica TaxID=138074 RepID=E9CKE8_9GAMM|nr:type II toxin-antitoxin system Phd/YefM family antitoxin [Serratia symbiotica]EFW12906.1 putative prevent-host-death family protein [Serratia symbiotica str. Tucson]MBF1996410.1 type II toxin-antitoxin system Phd/YefM family antitoxin [Serratia symbiotica]MBQ0954684.1 type II toxin-antitoxin system Phd/YefM family antitoxin [Serratia symbiotica]NIH11106.1 type II toxin-antitoxin system Phd/YefM family antitoxin [Serratia symbiotica]QLH63714.1 type II toxin-antitoxin system Phd/YefM family a